jgi:hypothetical protein
LRDLKLLVLIFKVLAFLALGDKPGTMFLTLLLWKLPAAGIGITSSDFSNRKEVAAADLVSEGWWREAAVTAVHPTF